MTMPYYASPEQLMRDKSEYARKGISRGRSVAVVTYADGVLFIAENPSSTLHKVGEIYDRIGFAAVGRYSEFESLRVAGVRLADVRGYSYNRRDVTGRVIANAYAQTLGEVFTQQMKPFEVELCVAEVGDTPESDQLYRLTFDGSIVDEPDFVVMGGQADAVTGHLRQHFTAGLSLARGLRNVLHAVVRNGGLPRQVDRSAFTVGEDLGVTPGAVVHRDEVIEVIQYAPSTPRVRQRPLVIVPPPIGRFYFLDLRPGRSLVEYAVSQGLQVFMISWRNPTREQAEWGLDAYAGGVVTAVDVAREITGSDDVTTLGLCAGGQVMTTALNHLAANNDGRVHAAGYAVTLLDFSSQAPLGAFSGPRLLEIARRNSRRRGVISAQQMGSMFTWMRPDDLIFNYLVEQWLMGEDPPAFDILAWNADGTNLPARLHEQFLDIFGNNALVKPGALRVLGTPVHLSRITLPTFVTGALTDHITPWHGCYRTTQLLSGPSTFVLSSSGHIQSLVNPPGNPKASYWTGGEPGPDPHAWRAAAEQHTGSWWEPWSEWAVERSGSERPAPETLGSAAHPPLEPAPGSYVRDRVPA